MLNLFAHRGFWQEKNLQNSIASLDAAASQKFFGVEFDIWLCDGKLVLKHDEPLPGEALPLFHQYLKYKNELHYWLDFKNLDEKNCAEIFAQVQIVLSENHIDLNKVFFAPFITDYILAKKILEKAREVFGKKIHFVAVCEKKENMAALQNFLEKNHVTHLSIFHGLLDKNSLKNFSTVEIFAWTLNDKARIAELAALGVTNFATDKITPQIYENTKSASGS